MADRYDPTPLVEAANVPEHPTYAHDQEIAREAFLAMGKGADSITSHLMRLIGRVRVETQVQLQRDAAAKDAEIARLQRIERAAFNVTVNANRGNDGVSAVPGCLIADLRAALREPRA